MYICQQYQNYISKFKAKRRYRVENEYEPFVYIIKETETEKFYIGSRTQYIKNKCKETDLGTIYFTSSKYIKEIWKEDNTKFEIIKILSCYSNHDAAILEMLLIQIYNAVFSTNFLNKAHPNVGLCVSGVPQSKEHREKRINSFKKYLNNMSEEERLSRLEKNKKGSLKRYQRPGEREKISKTIKKMYADGYFDEAKKRISELSKERHKNGYYDESYKKISIKTKGVKKPDGFGEKISKALKGRKFSDSTKRKMSEAKRGKNLGKDNVMSNPEHRKKVGESKIGRKLVLFNDGHREYVLKEKLENYHLHSNGKYYECEEELKPETISIFG